MMLKRYEAYSCYRVPDLVFMHVDDSAMQHGGLRALLGSLELFGSQPCLDFKFLSVCLLYPHLMRILESQLKANAWFR